MKFRVVRAVFSREFFAYFGSPTGYVFITLFVFLSALGAFWQERFFQANLANLDQLNAWFPYLLVFLIPSITMTLWADEKRQGTEELLLTLPAGDGELVLGKYFAALGIYTVALIFSLSHVVVLFWLGSPDLGMLASAYLGYWLMGAALIPLGLVASQLTDNLTVAFILGAVFCAIPVFLRQAGAILTGSSQRLAEQLSVPEQFRDLSSGVITVAALVYFTALGAAVLYLSVKLAGRRRWPASGLGWHFGARALCLLAATAALTVIAGRAGTRADVTSERVHSLSPDTLNLLRSIDPRRPVFIQAYLSPEVPRSYLEVRSSLSNLLREYSAIGRERLNVRIVETVKYSAEAREARERYGINPFRVSLTEESGEVNNEIFLGLVFSSGGEEFVIPQFDRGLPVEYELTRSIRVVSRAKRKKVGVLQTSANLFGGFDFQRRANTNEWPIVSELKKQYEVAQVAAGNDYPDDTDVLLAVLPHTLSAADLARLTAYVQKGKPALIVVDPLPAFSLQLSPGAAAETPEGQTPATTVSDTRPLMNALGVEWNPSLVVWDTYNPHPQLRSLPPEIVFIGKGNQAPMPFQLQEDATSGLQEVVLMYPGQLRERSDGKTKFTPLLTTGSASGTLRWNQLVQRTMFGTNMVQGQAHNPTGKLEVVAARVARTGSEPLNAMVFADADMIGEQFFDIRKTGVEYLNLDNVTLALNAIDDLAGDKSFIALRKRRPRHRTLEAVESRTRQYEQQRDVETQQAATVAAQRLKEAQARLDQAVAKIESRQDLDDQAKQIMISSVQAAENRRLQVARTNIEDERQRQIENARAAMESSVRSIQNTIKLLAVALPPIPAFVLFLAMSVRKVARERARIAPERLVTAPADKAAEEVKS